MGWGPGLARLVSSGLWDWGLQGRWGEDWTALKQGSELDLSLMAELGEVLGPPLLALVGQSKVVGTFYEDGTVLPLPPVPQSS